MVRAAFLVHLGVTGATAFAPNVLLSARHTLQARASIRSIHTTPLHTIPVGCKGGGAAMLETKTKTCTQLHAGESAAGDSTRATDTKKMEKFVSAVQTSTWLSWWAQVILSVVSAVTLFFANAVKGAGIGNILSNGIFLAGIGLALAFVNIAWTTTYSSSASKLATALQAGKEVKTAPLSRSVKVGVIIALSGMLITLMGAEQIVGTLVAKSISGSLLYASMPAQAVLAAQSSNMQLQALDIFVVQANTNTLLSHLASLVCSLFIAARRPSD